MRLCALFLLLVCAALAQLPYMPMGRTAYTTSSFGENRGTRYHAGVDYSTEMQEGWPVIAPADGAVEFLGVSPFGYGKHLRFRTMEGELWLYAHLSGFAAPLDSIVARLREVSWRNSASTQPGLRFKAGDTLAYSGSTGIGNPHLHVEIRSPEGKRYFNPCKNAIACTDTLPPFMLGLAAWEKNRVALTPLSLLDSGIARAPAGFAMKGKLHLALKIADYSRYPLENPMSIYRLEARQGGKSLYKRLYDTLEASRMLAVRHELLWAEEADSAGDWHHFIVDVRGKEPVVLEAEDFVGHVTRREVKFYTEAPSLSLPRLYRNQDSLLFTFLARPWISLSPCSTGRWELQASNGSIHVLSPDLCHEKLPYAEGDYLPLALVAERWARATRLLYIEGTDTLRTVHMRILSGNGKQVLEENGVKQTYTALSPVSWTSVVAWQSLPAHDSMPERLEFHPKGLQLLGNWELCLDSSLAPSSLYWLGETERRWHLFSKAAFRNGQQCVYMDELRDVASLSDTKAPTAGMPYAGSLMAFGRYTPSLRVPLQDDLSGPDFPCLRAYDPAGRWVPLDYDSEPRELVFDYADLPLPGQKLKLELCDEAGNKSVSWVTIPSLRDAPSAPVAPVEAPAPWSQKAKPLFPSPARP